MSTSRGAQHRSRLTLLLLALAAALLAPAPAGAKIIFTVDVKAHPSVFKANTEVEVPLFLVENRAPDVDTSWFSKYPAGLREVWVDIGSVQSRFVGFTPNPAFDGRGTNNPSAEGFDVHEVKVRDLNGKSRIYLKLYATRGQPGTVDGSGITGRTEVELGKLRIAVGAHADVGNGQKIVLDYTVGDDASAPDPGFGWWSRLPDAQGKNWGTVGGVGITWPLQTRVFWDGTLENEGNAPGDGAAGPNPPADPGPAPVGDGPQAPGVSSLGYTGKLRKAKKASKSPFSVLSKQPKKGTPAVKVTVTGGTSLTATMAKVGKKGKLSNLKGERIFEVKSLETFLKLTGSWNKKTLPKGTYRLTLRSPSGTAQTVDFKVT